MTKEASKLHLSAAENYGKAAEAHLKAADAYKAGNIGEAASQALVADGFAAMAEEAKMDAVKEHADEYADQAVDPDQAQ